MSSKTKYRTAFVRQIVCGDRTGLPLPAGVSSRNLKRVWLVMNEERIKSEGLVHLRSAFLNDEGHDWKVKTVDGVQHLVFFGNAEYKKPCDLVLEYDDD